MGDPKSSLEYRKSIYADQEGPPMYDYALPCGFEENWVPCIHPLKSEAETIKDMDKSSPRTGGEITYQVGFRKNCGKTPPYGRKDLMSTTLYSQHICTLHKSKEPNMWYSKRLDKDDFSQVLVDGGFEAKARILNNPEKHVPATYPLRSTGMKIGPTSY